MPNPLFSPIRHEKMLEYDLVSFCHHEEAPTGVFTMSLAFIEVMEIMDVIWYELMFVTSLIKYLSPWTSYKTTFLITM